jgi:hypothetical protein
VAGDGGDGGVWEERRPTTRGGAPLAEEQRRESRGKREMCGGERGGHGIKKTWETDLSVGIWYRV